MNSRSQNTACGVKGIDADIVVAHDKKMGLRQFCCRGRVSGKGEPLPGTNVLGTGVLGSRKEHSAGTALEPSALPQRVEQVSAPNPGSGWSLPSSVSFLSPWPLCSWAVGT